ncbi:hypothetical protein D3C76_585060 [compost metagenome]
MHQARDQAVYFVQGQHHGADHHRVFQLLLGHRCVEVLAFAQLDHGFHVAPANQFGVENLQPRRQRDALGAGHGVDVFGFGQQHAAGDAAGLADGCGLHQQWLGAFWQDDALVGLLRTLNQLVAEHCRRQAQFAWRAAALVQPGRVEVAGDEVGDELGTLAVVHRDFAVQRVELVGGVVRAGADRKDRQAGLQCTAAQAKDTHVRLAVAGQQQAGQGHAIDRCQADSEDDVVAVAGGYHQGTRGQ